MIATLAELDRRLASRRLLFGSQITEADVRLWPTLARFDTGYNPLAGVSERRLTDFASLWAYARDLYQRPGLPRHHRLHVVRRPDPRAQADLSQDGSWRIKVDPAPADWDAPARAGAARLTAGGGDDDQPGTRL